MCGVWHGRRDNCSVTAQPLQVIALFGPTGVGKTGLAIALAERLRARGEDPVALSADAFQLYRGLETLSGAPSAAERGRLEHLLVASHDITEQMSAGRFAEEAHAAIDAALASGRRPIVIGGSGLYMQAVLTSLDMRPPLDEAMAARASQLAGADASERARLLAGHSSEAAELIDEGDGYRSGRAVALAEAGEEPSPGTGFWEAPRRHPTVLFGISRQREELYARIEARVDQMVRDGAGEEVDRAIGSASATARKVIGFDELPAGETEAMKARTRRYAKRQLTWLRRMDCEGIVDLSRLTTDEAAATIAAAATGTGTAE
ncbi:MAG: tRNA (adenosine(37)-N6)-dimethylallyltransferase MiaA [Solirubrobacteraceae bacterium]|nr:tRNA (adenosine(37)-N6)-dimethylallyltransferase MiaA [Solirubrobacteraceae bacterium]